MRALCMRVAMYVCTYVSWDACMCACAQLVCIYVYVIMYACSCQRLIVCLALASRSWRFGAIATRSHINKAVNAVTGERSIENYFAHGHCP